jgi:hypothetical protein
MEVRKSSEASVSYHITTRRDNPADWDMDSSLRLHNRIILYPFVIIIRVRNEIWIKAWYIWYINLNDVKELQSDIFCWMFPAFI